MEVDMLPYSPDDVKSVLRENLARALGSGAPFTIAIASLGAGASLDRPHGGKRPRRPDHPERMGNLGPNLHRGSRQQRGPFVRWQATRTLLSSRSPSVRQRGLASGARDHEGEGQWAERPVFRSWCVLGTTLALPRTAAPW